MRLTLRTLLAYLDDTLEAAKSREIGQKLAESGEARELVDRIKRVVRKRSLGTPNTDATLVTAYLSDTLSPDSVGLFEQQCLESDAHLAEVAAVHQILTLLLCEQARVPPSANRRMYKLVSGRESSHDRKPGNTIPVGGARDTDRAGDDIDDAAYLLGLSGYTRAEAPGQYAVKGVIGVLLALLVVVAAILAWPKSDAPAELAQTRPAAVETPLTPAAGPEPAAPTQDAAATPAAEKPAEPLPEKPTEPAPADQPPAEKPEPPAEKAELAPGKVETSAIDKIAASPERTPLGMLTPKPNAVVVSVTPTNTLARIGGDKAVVYGTESLMALPGYKAAVALDSGVTIDLWGNLPVFFPTPLPLLESRVTPFAPPAGLVADLRLDSGRVYLVSNKPVAQTLRLRVGNRVWDVKFADKGARLAAEVAHSLAPAGEPEPTRARGGLYMVSGLATLTPVEPAGPPQLLDAGASIHFDSRSAEATAVPADPKNGAAAYWGEFVTPGDRKRAELTILALNDFATKLVDPSRVRETFYGGLPTAGQPSPQAEAAAQVALFALAAVNDVPKLAAALVDSERPLVRATAAEGLRAAAADEPGALKTFADTLTATGTTPAQAEEAVKLLRGIPPDQQGSAAAAAKVVEQLRSDSLAVRELAYGLLRGAIEPQSPEARALYGYDPGAPEADRAVAVEAWVKWAKGLGEKK